VLLTQELQDFLRFTIEVQQSTHLKLDSLVNREYLLLVWAGQLRYLVCMGVSMDLHDMLLGYTQ
jgi:hypothetical protein